MPRLMKIILGIMIAFVILMIIGYIMGHSERTAQIRTSVSNLCPVGNTSTSFCIVKEGKPYYFAIEGWELPSREEIESTITIRSSAGLYVWLKVRTNLDLEIDADNVAYVRVGEQYKPVLHAEPWLQPIRRGKDTLLIPYRFPPSGKDIATLLKAIKVRLYFDVSGYYDFLPTNGCIEGILFTHGAHGPGFYVNFTPPPTLLKVLDVEGRCIDEDLCVYNVDFELRGGYLILVFSFNESTGRKSQADFPVHVNAYVEKHGKLLLTNEDLLFTAIPPLPPSVFDVWREPEHEYVATVIPPGTFTLVFKAYGAIYPEPLFSGMTVVIGTPWGGAKIEPKIEVVKIVNISATTYENKVLINEVNVVVKNTGKIPVVIPQACFSYDAPPNYRMLKGKLDSTDLIYVTQGVNGRWDRGGGSSPAIVVNPGETITVPLTPIASEGFGLELSLEDLNRNHVIEIESIYTNTSCNITIPPLKAELSIHNVTKLRIEESNAKFDIHLLVSNNWIMPVNTEWIKVRLDNETLDEFWLWLPYEEIEPNKSMSVDIKMNLDDVLLYKILMQHRYLRLCLGSSCLNIPLTDITYRLGKEASVGDLAIQVLNISMTKVIGVKWYNILKDKSEIDYYEAPKEYSILVVYIEVKNKGMKSMILDSVDVDDSVIIIGKGMFELTYLSELVHSENVSSAVIVDEKHLWKNIGLTKLRPGESYVIALVFAVPENAKISYIIVEAFPYKVVFST